MKFETWTVRHERQRQAPSHHIEQDKARPVLVVGASLVQDLVGDFLAVQNYHMIAQDIEVYNIGICGCGQPSQNTQGVFGTVLYCLAYAICLRWAFSRGRFLKWPTRGSAGGDGGNGYGYLLKDALTML